MHPGDEKSHPLPPAKKRVWIVRHPILTTLIFMATVIVLAIVVTAIGAAVTAHSVVHPNNAAPAAAPTVPSPSTSGIQTPNAGPEVLSTGDSAAIEDSFGQPEGTVTVKSVTVTTRPADPEFGQKPDNGYYVVVHVSATADKTYNEGFDVSSLDFYANDGQHRDQGNGNAYDALSSSQSNEDVSATLAQGESSSGWLAFDVSSPHGSIAYAPNMDGQPLAVWHY